MKMQINKWQDYPDDQGVVWDGNYYQCIEDLVDHCDMEGIEVPSLVWATSPKGGRVHITHIRGTEKLEKAVEKFNAANKHLVIYWEDHDDDQKG